MPTVSTSAMFEVPVESLERRGRKNINLDKYKEETTAKIKQIRQKLDDPTNKLSAKEKQKLRNQITAQMSRLQKKLLERHQKEKLD